MLLDDVSQVGNNEGTDRLRVSLLRSSCRSSLVLASRIATLVTARSAIHRLETIAVATPNDANIPSFMRYRKASICDLLKLYGSSFLFSLACCLMTLASTFSSFSVLLIVVGLCFPCSSLGITKESAMPARPALAVRPILWVYDEADVGMSKLTTAATFLKSIPGTSQRRFRARSVVAYLAIPRILHPSCFSASSLVALRRLPLPYSWISWSRSFPLLPQRLRPQTPRSSRLMQ